MSNILSNNDIMNFLNELEETIDNELLQNNIQGSSSPNIPRLNISSARRLLGAIANRYNINSVLNSSLNDTGNYKQILSEDGENKMEEIKYSKDTCINNSCSIFHIDFAEGDTIIKLPCNHCFVPEAIKKWLKEEKAECPVCRVKLPSKEVKINQENHEAEPATAEPVTAESATAQSATSEPATSEPLTIPPLPLVPPILYVPQSINFNRVQTRSQNRNNILYEDDSDDEDLKMAIMASLDTIREENNKN